MATIKFVGVDENARTASFEVDGLIVTRKIPNSFVGALDDYLQALINGLHVEASQKEAVMPKPLGETAFKAGDTVVEGGELQPVLS